MVFFLGGWVKTLIVDRVKLFHQMIETILSNTDIEHGFASTGKEALNALEAEKYDCICVALYLDDMDGFEFTREVRKREAYTHTPIVLLTSEKNADTTSKAINSGITDIFHKENIHELVNFIERFSQVEKPIHGKVLYIEDQQSQREYVTAMFEERELEVDAFSNAEDALQAFLKNRYHLVVTDIILEGEVSGVLLINKIRRLDGPKGDTPILAITAFDDSSRRISLYHMGITDYVTKPIIKEELLARVRNLINNQKALEREIEFREHYNSEEVVRRGMKLEALGKLTGGIAHDYNNMMGIITGYTDLLKMQLVEQPDLLSYVDQIEKAGERGVKLTSKLLSFTRKNVVTSEVVNVNKLIAESQPMLENIFTAGVKFTAKLDEDLWNIKVDTGDFENSLLNICINAKHAMGDKGIFTIMTANTKMGSSSAEKYGLLAGEYVRLSIMDTGCGMDRETVAKIFDPFFSTKGDDGTGLGLSQVYGFVQRVKGSVRVESKPGKGSLFTLYFPRDNAAETNEVSEIVEDIVIKKKQCNILVVDDEVALTELTAEILTEEGHQVETSFKASEALDAMKKQTFDIMISDVVMPGMNGFELADKVKAEYPDIKIIMVSGYNDQFSSKEKINHSCDAQLEKPVSAKQLLDTIDSVFS